MCLYECEAQQARQKQKSPQETKTETGQTSVRMVGGQPGNSGDH